MIKLVNFLKINFTLIIICFFLPFIPFFSCESEKDSNSSSLSVDSVNVDSVTASSLKIISSFPDSSSRKNDSLLYESHNVVVAKDISLPHRVLDYLSFTKYKTIESNRSITAFGILVLSSESIFSDQFDIFEWRNYLVPISFITCILGLLGSIRSKRRKHQFLFVCSVTGLVAISIIGFLVGNISELLYGFWMMAVLFLINSLLSFILWKNYFVKGK